MPLSARPQRPHRRPRASNLAPLTARSCATEQLLNHFFQSIEIDRLGQVLGKPRVTGPVDIVFHSETAQGDSRQTLTTQFLHQFISAPIRQTDVTDEQIKIL